MVLILAYAREPDDSAFDLLRQFGVTEKGQSIVKGLLCAVPPVRPSAEGALSYEWRRITLDSKPLSGKKKD
jgi:hypothetical protein